ncbi:MAG TPA: hypothetical protein DCM68_07810, partial [Verrucomicrobia bacterium]|nr:hypothetical protein [Verrucomicrobiota bacterium]
MAGTGLWGVGFCVAAVLWLGPAVSGSAGEVSEPVVHGRPAADSAAPGDATRTLKRDLAAAHSRLAEVEASLAQETKGREKAVQDLVSAWKQLKATRDEAEKLQRQVAETSRLAGRAREFEKRLADNAKELDERKRQLETARESQTRLQRQVDDLQKRTAAIPALEGRVDQAQADVAR